MNLLSKQDNRRLELIKLLVQTKEWITLKEINLELGIPSRTLKEDIRFLNQEFDDFIIETSVNGIKINFKNNKGPKSFIQTLIIQSRNYQLLEMIFLNNQLSVKDIAERTFMSQATIYRIIHTINDSLQKQFGFFIQTNPCRIVGDEQEIRFYFYAYFFEKYTYDQWPFSTIDLDSFKKLLDFTIEQTRTPVDFAYYNVFKIITAVNFIRFQQNCILKVDTNENTLQHFEMMFRKDKELYTYLEKHLQIQLDAQTILQIFPQYMEDGIYYSLESFMTSVKQDSELAHQVQHLQNILKYVATNNQIEIPDLNYLTHSLFNTAHIEYKEPQSNHILYDRNTHISRDLAEAFPQFHSDLYAGMKEFRNLIGKPLTDSGINFYVYSIFSWWEDLIPQLQDNFKEINFLIVSDRHKTHARLIKDRIAYRFNHQVVIDYFIGSDMTELETMDFDLLITTFKMEEIEDIRSIYISNFPKSDDFIQIQRSINEIIQQRKNIE